MSGPGDDAPTASPEWLRFERFLTALLQVKPFEMPTAWEDRDEE